MKKNKFSYWFDNQMSRGTAALIKLLVIVTVTAVVVLGLAVAAFGASGIGGGLWISLTHMMDAGTIANDEGASLGYILGMLVITFIGVFVTSTLTGIICNSIDEKVADLRRGKSAVVEENHVVVLGTAGGLYTIVSELIEANSNHRHEALVILDDKDTKDVMDENIRQRFPDTKTTRVICRCGNITDVSDLEVCSFDTCRSVIINADDDFTTIKSILAVTRLLKQSGNDRAYIAAVIRDEENLEAAEVAGEGRAEVLSFQNMMSRIIAHTGRSAGLSQVYTELFDCDGSEFYIEEHPEAVGKTLGELNRFFPVSVAVGFVTKDGGILINPESDRRAEAGDRLILFAEDDGESRMDASPAPVREDDILGEYVKEPAQRTDMLLVGYSSKLRQVLEEEDNYVGDGSQMTVALSAEQMEHKAELEDIRLRNIRLKVVECDIYSRSGLESLLPGEDTVLVLADTPDGMDDAEIERRDAKILMILLQLRYLARTKGYKFTVTSEMLRVENQELAQIAEVNDFVISSNITSLILTQISQIRELRAIFNELLREEGSEIYVRPAGSYVRLSRETDIYTACEAAARRREVFIGYRTKDENGGVRIVTNPPKAQKVTFTGQDAFIVIATD